MIFLMFPLALMALGGIMMERGGRLRNAGGLLMAVGFGLTASLG